MEQENNTSVEDSIVMLENIMKDSYAQWEYKNQAHLSAYMAGYAMTLIGNMMKIIPQAKTFIEEYIKESTPQE
jgi:hypothetical protein